MIREKLQLNEYKKNILWYWKKANENNIQFVVYFEKKPIFEINPVNKNTDLDLKEKIEKWREEYNNWDFESVDFDKIENWDDFVKFLKS
jgi:hypothetical protein